MMRLISEYLLCIYVCIIISVDFSKESGRVSYDKYSLLRITPKTQADLQFLRGLKRRDEKTGEKLVDFWLTSSAVNHSVDVMVAPSVIDKLLKTVNARRMPYKVLIENVGSVLEDQIQEAFFSVPSQTDPETEFFDSYKHIDEIYSYMTEFKTSYPEYASIIKIGRSYEGRPLNVLKISTSHDGKPVIWIQAGAHAREQIAPPVVLYIAQQLILKYELNRDVHDIVDAFDWYILPVVNPDGFEYCQIDRLWRKTRSLHVNIENCVGVDANRNWDIKWSAVNGSDQDPCSDVYAGPAAFSEPETQAISEFMAKYLLDQVILFIDFHSYSQKWLTPWGYSSKLPPSFKEQKRLAEVATSALNRINGTLFSIGSSGNHMYTVTGGARDYVFDVIGAAYSYVVELRDRGSYGFLLPGKQILPTAVETWHAVKAMALDLLSNS